MATYVNLGKALGGDNPTILHSCAVADLPAASTDLTGAIAYCTDALAASETTGNGTGNVAFCNGTGWKRIDTGAAIGA